MKTPITQMPYALVLILSLLGSTTLLAGDAQTANKPNNMITLIENGLCGGPSAYASYKKFDGRVMDDLSLTAFTIPPGYKFIVTSSNVDAVAVLGAVGRPMVIYGLNVDVAIPPGATLCVGSSSFQSMITGHLEKDVP